jgi:hypothetical protein
MKLQSLPLVIFLASFTTALPWTQITVTIETTEGSTEFKTSENYDMCSGHFDTEKPTCEKGWVPVKDTGGLWNCCKVSQSVPSIMHSTEVKPSENYDMCSGHFDTEKPTCQNGWVPVKDTGGLWNCCKVSRSSKNGWLEL